MLEENSAKIFKTSKEIKSVLENATLVYQNSEDVKTKYNQEQRRFRILLLTL